MRPFFIFASLQTLLLKAERKILFLRVELAYRLQ